MYQMPWEQMEQEDVPRLLAEINDKLGDASFDPNVTTIEEQDMPFYADFKFLRVTDPSSGEQRLLIYGPGNAYVLNWTNQPIYTANEKAPIMINEDTAPLYVKFFFDHVRGRHGRFMIVENADEINWAEEPPEDGKKAINEMITPVTVFENEEGSPIKMTSFMIFKDSLFKANVIVERDGMVSLSDEALIVEGMPVIPDPTPEQQS